jgi:uncharacterized protein YqgC (DUF456 family)
MTHHALLYALAILLVVIGLVGVVLPALPGLPFVFAGMILAAWADGFREIGWVTLTVLGLMTLVSFIVDFWATAHGAKRVGASKYAVWGAILGTFAGLFIMPPLGLFVGPFVGALIGELIHGKEIRQAAKVGFGTWLGLVMAIVLKMGLAFAMIGVFAFAWFF